MCVYIGKMFVFTLGKVCVCLHYVGWVCVYTLG